MASSINYSNLTEDDKKATTAAAAAAVAMAAETTTPTMEGAASVAVFHAPATKSIKKTFPV